MDSFRRKRKTKMTRIAAIFFVLFAASFSLALDEETVTLDAEKIIYDDESGTASAEGRALLSYKDIRITADRIDYDDESGKVVATSPPDVGVSLSNAQQTIRGSKLEYDISSGEGVFSSASSNVAVDGTFVRVKGENLEAIPEGEGGDYYVKWDDVKLTTCALEHPHYRLEAKRFVFTPRKRVVVERPRVYLGDWYIFTYPFDYIINVQRSQGLRAALLPKFSYTEDRGAGVGFSGPLTWEGGGIKLGVLYWAKVGFEGEAFLEQKWGNVTFGAGVEYSWDREWDEKIARPTLSSRYENKGWFAELRLRHNEYVELQKDADYQYRGKLDTSPEFLIGTHWKAMADGSWYRISARWGEYRETILTPDRDEISNSWFGRLKFTAESYGEKSWNGGVVPFWGVNASTMFYDTQSMRQDFFSAIIGFKYKLGDIGAGSAYQRAWRSGESPMRWDFEEQEEKVFQKFEVPFGKYISFGVLGGYDLRASFLEEMNYSLRYTNDCMLWEFSFRNDRNADGENKMFFRVGLVGTDAMFRSDEYKDPFDPPSDLPKK